MVCCVLCCGVVCAVWCVVCDTLKNPCVHSTRPHVYRHLAHMLKHVCAWCPYTRGRFERTHGDVWSGHTEGCEGEGGVVVSLVFHRYINWMLGSPLVANFLLTKICPHRVIAVPRGSPKVTLDLNPFSVREQVENNTCLIPLIIRST